MGYRSQAIWGSFRMSFLHFLADPQWLIPNIIAPFVVALVALLLFKDVSGPVALYAILGGGMMGMWGNTLYASGFSIDFDKWMGTIEQVLAAPSRLLWVITGRSMWNTLLGTINGLAVLLIVEFGFGARIAVRDWPLFILAMVMSLIALACLGLVFASGFVLTRQTGVLANSLEFPIYLAAGTMFPIAFLPFWTHPLSLFLAPSWGIEAIRWAAMNWDAFPLGYWGNLAVLTVISAGYISLAILLFRVVEAKARREATLTRY